MNMRQQLQGSIPTDKTSRMLKTLSLLSLYLGFAMFVGGIYYTSITTAGPSSQIALAE